MRTKIRKSARVALLMLAFLPVACATISADRPANLSAAKSPAWSLESSPRGIVVAVSPVRQSVQILSTYAAIVGGGIDAMVNDRYRKEIRETLGDYDPGVVFKDRLTARLTQAVPRGIAAVRPLGATAGFSSTHEAEAVRYRGLTASGHDLLLDLKVSYGIFGPAAMLVVKIEGQLTLLPEGHRLWHRGLLISPEPVLANDKLKDPTDRLKSNLTSPRFTVKQHAMDRWTRDGGNLLRSQFEAAVDGAVSAALCDLGLARESSGEYYLGRIAMAHKKFAAANEHFKKALEIQPDLLDARCAHAVNLAHNHQVDDAIRLTEEVTRQNPDCGPAWFNLAWWYAVDKKDAAKAAPCYEEALQHGMPEAPKIERVLPR